MQEGCDKFCSFCVVPYTRGAEVSRPVEQVLAEARGLVDAGVRELTLLGQNVNAYHGLDARGLNVGLGELCARLSGIEGLARIRYTTSHPSDMTDELIAAHRDLPKLMPYLHLPVQSGSDSILKAMNRRHTRADYLRVIGAGQGGAARSSRMSGDFIVGFPGETDADFEATLSIVARSRLRLGLYLQILDPSRHARRQHGRSGARAGQDRAPRPSQRADHRPDARFRQSLRRSHPAVLLDKQGPQCRASSAAARPICRPCTWKPPSA